MLKLETLVYDLPEDVLKRKWAGDFEGEIALIDALLQKDIPGMLKDRLRVERRMAELLPAKFCYNREQAMEMMREVIPDFTVEELEALELDRAVEYIYRLGEKYYLNTFRDALLKVNADIALRAGAPIVTVRPVLDAAVAELKEKGSLAYRFRVRGTMKIHDDAFVPGAKMRVHMPLPQRCAQQSEIEINMPDAKIDGEWSAQRTAYFERISSENMPFTVEYSYKNEIRYVDLLNGPKPERHIYPDAPAPTGDDLSEQAPHIMFTPYMRALAEEIKGNETDPVRIAWKFYEYVTTKIRYSYMRPYFLIDRHPEYCVLNGKGDCGIQALTFITLCRIAGIPARWQSGLEVEEKTAGCHDWAQFYVEPYGWVFADCSFGGTAKRVGSDERWKFYFGNLDPFRMVANSRYQTDFNPPKSCDRADPYDNQEGEAEIDGNGLFSLDFDTGYETLEYRKL